MADLGLFDIVALAKAGYKKKDIDAILAGAGDDTPKPADASDPETKEPKEGKEPAKVPAKDPEPTDSKGDETPAPDEDKDYKKLYEDMQKSTEDLQKQIKDLQTRINSKDSSNSSGRDTTIDDLMTSFKNFS